MALIAEDGNPLPGIPRVQSEVFMAAGKTYDLMINATASATALPFFDRELSLSAAQTGRDSGMLAYIGLDGATTGPVSALTASAGTVPAYFCEAGQTLAVTDPGKGVLANAKGANGATLGTVSLPGTLSFNNDGTFTYASPSTGCLRRYLRLQHQWVCPATATITECDSTTQGSGCALTTAPMVVSSATFISNIRSRYASAPPGVLAGATGAGVGVTAVAAGTANPGIQLNADGSFIATQASSTSATCPSMTPALPTGTACTSFQFRAKTSQGQLSSNTGTAYVAFLPATGLVVNLVDGATKAALPGSPQDYRWIIEEDRTFFVDPNNTTNSGGTAIVPDFRREFPHQLHAGRRDGLHGSAVVRVGADLGRSGSALRRRQRHLHDGCRPGDRRAAGHGAP